MENLKVLFWPSEAKATLIKIISLENLSLLPVVSSNFGW